MKLLADANVETAIVEWLRSRGHDVLWAAQLSSSIPDDDLLNRASTEERVVLTHDRDFGDLVFRRGLSHSGIVLMRFRAPLQTERLALFQTHWPLIENRASGQFIVVSDKRIRIRALPLTP